MSSAFVLADILKQMFGCLFSGEIKLSWLWWGLLPVCLGTVPAGHASDPGAVLSFPARGMMPAQVLRKRCLRPRGWWEHPGSAPSCCFAGKEEEKVWGFLRQGITSAAGSLLAFPGCPRRETGGKGTAFVASLSYPCLYGTCGCSLSQGRRRAEQFLSSVEFLIKATDFRGSFRQFCIKMFVRAWVFLHNEVAVLWESFGGLSAPLNTFPSTAGAME